MPGPYNPREGMRRLFAASSLPLFFAIAPSDPASQSFRYRALVDGEPFIARLDTDAFGAPLLSPVLPGARSA